MVEVAGLEAMIPDNVILGVEECLQRCNISRVIQPTLQREPRNSANALPSGFSGPTPASAAVVSPSAVVSAPSLLSSALAAVSAYAAAPNQAMATVIPVSASTIPSSVSPVLASALASISAYAAAAAPTSN